MYLHYLKKKLGGKWEGRGREGGEGYFFEECLFLSLYQGGCLFLEGH